ncbi:tryptophan halogenase family protein [Agaribacterium haliotis]|uniref:tryptophan halogenase family protein n=1 Tax=Agaribacterium haliotis TaxID=2013869 RepID=UPI000BB58462|nr:tryptophan halogenase family protein [Agaribacterium haliotis]
MREQLQQKQSDAAATAIKRLLIVGGGTAGWMAAALLKKVLGAQVELSLLESEQIAPVGVGEATIPQIQHVNQVLGFDEAEFLRETKASLKLAIKFENWKKPGSAYFHSFGAAGQSRAFCQFHHYLSRARAEGICRDSVWDYDLNYLVASQNKFAKLAANAQGLQLPYAYHFDASLYARYLRKIAERDGVCRIEGLFVDAERDADSGRLKAVILEDGRRLEADMFIDCSGFRALLMQKVLNTGYQSWKHWLPCDRALAVPSRRLEKTLPYTRAIAHGAGWQWRIPLQHRNGNGLVFSSHYYSQDQARQLLLNNIDSELEAEPRLLSFEPGRCLKQWHKNVVAVGLSSGFIEPLESTSIHLIQSAIVRLLKFFPFQEIEQSAVDEYNRLSKLEYEQIRDFIILHYHVNQRDDSQFWKDLRHMSVPESLSRKITMFRNTGYVQREQDDLFHDASWMQVLLGQGVEPKAWHPLANAPDSEQLKAWLESIKQNYAELVQAMPGHDEFIEKFTAD